MQFSKRWLVVLLIIASLQLSACGKLQEVTAEEVPPAVVEHLEGGPAVSRITLSMEAAQRLDIRTAPVREEQVNGTQQKVIPYAALLYDPQGNTWTYTNAEPLIFVRQPITVDRIEGDLAVLSDGPDSGVAVVTVGATELFGAELEFEEE